MLQVVTTEHRNVENHFKVQGCAFLEQKTVHNNACEPLSSAEQRMAENAVESSR